MRRKHFGGAAAVACAAVALIPIAAGASPRHQVSERVPALTIHAVPDPITAGDPVVIFGRLFSRERAGRLVVLYHRVAGDPGGFRPVQQTRTDATGAYEFTRADGRVDSNRAWFAAAGDVRSRVVIERVAALVTVAATGPGGVAEPDGSQLTTGVPYVFAGTVSPAQAGALVALQRQDSNAGDDWHTIDRAPVAADGTYSITHRFVVPSGQAGDATVRILMRKDVRNAASASDSLSYEIEQAQNPALTITAAANPIAEGGADAISGVDAAGSGRLLALWARDARSGWHEVGQTFSGAGGAYSFAVAPLYNTGYRVVVPSGRRDAAGATGSSGTTTGATGSTGATGEAGPSSSAPPSGRVASAILFLGVRDALTAQASATTVAQGQSVTFSGGVLPDKTGHLVALQQQDATGGGWHVIAVAAVGANSAYQITQSFYDAGTAVVRVKIPGGPDNQGAVSPPFTITVNAVPASALVPAGG